MRHLSICQVAPMTRETRCRETTFGYLSALESAEHGFFGGYLLISGSGRPLEFHCTAPVRPNRAQQLLYGPTLRPYLLGEQIGGTLVREAAISPQLILTDQDAVLALRSQIEVPIVFVGAAAEEVSASIDAGDSPVGGRWFQHRGNSCELAAGYEAEAELVVRLLTELSQKVELMEPFGRIHDAIREAQRIGGEGPEIYGQAA
jgi:hypothetical protein